MSEDYDYNNEVYEKVISLSERNTQLENEVAALNNKLEHKTGLLDMVTKNVAKLPKKQSEEAAKRRRETFDYYHNHRNDADVLEYLKPFKEAYPGVRVPFSLIKHFTDKKLVKEKENGLKEKQEEKE